VRLELSGVHDTVQLGKLHVSELSDTKLVRDIRASVVLVDVGKVVMEDGVT
jgi:hypothetical protein